MNKIILIIVAFGIIALVGCTAGTQVTQESADQVKDTEGAISGDVEMEPTVQKKLKANPDLEDEIKTLKDGTKYLLNPKNVCYVED